ncbi:MAG TPA: chloride channel protein [Chitinophagales bacterium]|nr:chloride channel protein [Chitinophagales bacterium]HMX61347.1 chloride channel protein [Chitinophagales bacterium]HMY23978.1 chloride channel protein [Chitinophagales bacterium]HMZ34888.1 chloride channel protein [Chitinophagales bacterium]HNA39773.1 chloride channel protein [Chitinophagales bacterium]
MQNSGIPISISLDSTYKSEQYDNNNNKQEQLRLLRLSLIAICIAILVSAIARILVHLIDLFTNIAFRGQFSLEAFSPAQHQLGLFVICIPAFGGLLVGLMAYYGSKAIRGHGIPEAMEQILTNQSKIKPSITYLKPLSSAISIGTGGPFGAEGPIIATGGALGSTIGQLLHITPNERKILLAAGATAGMAAIFGSPIAAMFLAIELLLFEFSPRSFIPVALACITGAAGHHLLFGEAYVFPITIPIVAASNKALFFYSLMGLIIGLLSVGITKIVYWIEDAFEKIPIHWAWYPAIGGIAVGIIGYFNPKTLGVGYSNITDLLSGTMALQMIISLCLLKFISWAISLGSGTSGGTLAPLLTIGGAIGAIAGNLGNAWFPDFGISISLSALVGMSAMFAGASRAYLTSIIFALETTGQSAALLPLLAACTASYTVSYFLMSNTIMTEKIARRGVYTPHEYGPDLLERTFVSEVAYDSGVVVSNTMSIDEVRNWLKHEENERPNFIIITDENGIYKGVISSSNLFSLHHQLQNTIESLIKRKDIFILPEDSLKSAVELMTRENMDILPVLDQTAVVGILTYKNMMSIYKKDFVDNAHRQRHISLNRQRLKLLVRGQRLISLLKISK